MAAENMFTPPGGARQRESPFMGFRQDDRSESEILLRRRVIQVESEMENMKVEMEKMKGVIAQLVTDKDGWKSAYNELFTKVTQTEKKTSNCEVEVQKINNMQEDWRKEQEEEKCDFRKIVEEQNAIRKNELSKEVVKVWYDRRTHPCIQRKGEEREKMRVGFVRRSAGK